MKFHPVILLLVLESKIFTIFTTAFLESSLPRMMWVDNAEALTAKFKTRGTMGDLTPSVLGPDKILGGNKVDSTGKYSLIIYIIFLAVEDPYLHRMLCSQPLTAIIFLIHFRLAGTTVMTPQALTLL